MEVRINGKLYRNLETLSDSRLEHLAQLAQDEADNYRLEFSGKLKAGHLAHLQKLNERRKKIVDLIGRMR